MKFVPKETPSFWSDTSIWIKLLFLILIIVIVVILVRKFKQSDFFKKSPDQPSVTPNTQLRQTYSSSQVHLGIHIYRCDAEPVAQTIFGAFEAAAHPESVHVHLYQELNSQETLVDAFTLYRTRYLDRHSRKFNYLSHIHVKNANAADSAGPLVGFLLVAKELMLKVSHTPADRCVFVRPFYETPTSSNIFGVTFVQNYDETLRSVPPTNRIFTTSLRRTSLASDDVLHRAQTEAKHQSIAGLLLSNVAIPLLKNKMHNVELLNTNVCTAKSWAALSDQAGFTAWSTLDRCTVPPGIFARTKPSANVPVPFTIFRTFKHTRNTGDSSDQSHAEDADNEVIPVTGVCEDLIVMDLVVLSQVLKKIASNPELVKAVPYHAYTLMLTNLLGPNLWSANHLPLAIVADHQINTNYDGKQSIRATMAFRPHHWKRIPRIRKTRKKKKPIIDLVPCSDFNRILPLTLATSKDAKIASDNITTDAFLGITQRDTAATLGIKFGPPENLARRRRMLGEAQ